jgi:hypothetical protein
MYVELSVHRHEERNAGLMKPRMLSPSDMRYQTILASPNMFA